MKRAPFLLTVALLFSLFGGPALAAGGGTVEMTVDGMVCAFCAQGIEKKLRENSATDDVFISLEHHLVAVAMKGRQTITDTELKRVLTEAGYSVREVKHSSQSLQKIRARLES